MFLKPRTTFFLIFLCCLSLLSFGLYLQHVKGLEPCPLCVMQRYAFVAVGLVALIASLHNSKGSAVRLYGLGVTLSALGGLVVAGRHVWLEHLPKDQAPSCGPGLDFIIDSFPLSKALPMIFKGSGECADVPWRFLGLSISEWALMWFVLFVVIGLSLLILKSYARKIGNK
ncbi:MAG: disulfide bond formation protein B [Pseudomonadota bacterium]